MRSRRRSSLSPTNNAGASQYQARLGGHGPNGQDRPRDFGGADRWRNGSLAQRIEEFDARIETSMRPFDDAYLCARSMPGVAERAAQAILAEIGTDMSRFPTAAHLASWARVCPANNESAGKRRSSRTGKANVWLRATLNEAAWAAVKKKNSYYRALYQRMETRQGPKQAIGAVQHAMLKALWYMLSRHVLHEDLGVEHFTQRNVARIRHHHVRRLEQLGYRVTLEEAA